MKKKNSTKVKKANVQDRSLVQLSPRAPQNSSSYNVSYCTQKVKLLLENSTRVKERKCDLVLPPKLERHHPIFI